MKNWLVKDAIGNVWAKPNIDAQTICLLSRLSHKGLDRVLINLEGENLWLPTDDEAYCVYDLGSFHPIHGGLNIGYNEGWVTLENLVNRSGGSFVFYNLDGHILPSKYIYLMRTISDRFIVAIADDYRFFSLSKYDVYCRLYDHNITASETENYFSGVHITTYEIKDVYESNTAIGEFNAKKALIPGTYSIINGVINSNPTIADCPQGSYFEIISDDTVFKMQRFKISDLSSFHSELDNEKKFLLHFDKGGDVAYHDDIEIHIYSGNTGLYYHRHFRSSLTQITHGDFALSCKQVQDYALNMADWQEAEILIQVRESGVSNNLTYNSNRIHELYRLDDQTIVNTMIGLNSHLPFWRASNLEKSPINYLRSSPIEKITHDLVSDTYGYNAAIYYSVTSPSKVTIDGNGYPIVALSPLLNHNSMVYEYDANGLLNGWFPHLQGEYECKRNSTKLVEAIPGSGGNELDLIYGADDYQVDMHCHYRYYLQSLDEGIPIDVYMDVTDTDVYSINDYGTITWSYDKDRYRSVILSDRKHLVNVTTVEEVEGLIRVSVKFNSEHNGLIPSPFVFESCDVFLNKQPLVYSIDYLVDWPSITIINKTLLKLGAPQEVIVRARTPSSAVKAPNVGFVTGGLLSDNSKYDIKDDKILRIVVGGSVKHRDDVSFREDNSVAVPSIYNGKPYSIDEQAFPAEDLLSGNYEALRQADIAKDNKIEDFLTIHFPKPILTNVQPIEKRYPLYSPILNKMILDHESGVLHLEDDDVDYRISTKQLDMIMTRYSHLLSTDPAHVGYDEWFVEVEPHWGFGIKTIPALLYTLLERVNHRYFQNRVIVNRYLTIRND